MGIEKQHPFIELYEATHGLPLSGLKNVNHEHKQVAWSELHL